MAFAAYPQPVEQPRWRAAPLGGWRFRSATKFWSAPAIDLSPASTSRRWATMQPLKQVVRLRAGARRAASGLASARVQRLEQPSRCRQAGSRCGRARLVSRASDSYAPSLPVLNPAGVGLCWTMKLSPVDHPHIAVRADLGLDRSGPLFVVGRGEVPPVPGNVTGAVRLEHKGGREVASGIRPRTRSGSSSPAGSCGRCRRRNQRPAVNPAVAQSTCRTLSVIGWNWLFRAIFTSGPGFSPRMVS